MNPYFYIDAEGKQKGPFSPESLKYEPVKKETLVWTQGMEQWARADEVSELQFLFSGASAASYIPPQLEPTAPAYENTTAVQPKPKTYMVESILATVLPFLICWSIFSLLGIIGIVNASKVESLYRTGAYAEAVEASRQAKRWAKIAMWVGIVWAILWIFLFIAISMFVGAPSIADFSEMFSA
jgi:hypothetical protein